MNVKFLRVLTWCTIAAAVASAMLLAAGEDSLPHFVATWDAATSATGSQPVAAGLVG